MERPIFDDVSYEISSFSDTISLERFTLFQRANLNAVSYSGTTPLREAVVSYKKDIARLLIDGGAKATHSQTQGCGGGLSEFGWAIEYSQHDLAKYMIEKGAVDPRNPGDSLTAVYGRSADDVPVAKLLVDRGARPLSGDIEQLEKIAANNSWIAEAGHNAKIVSIYRDAMNSPDPDPAPPGPENDVVNNDVDLPELPDDLILNRVRSAPPVFVKTRSMKAKQEQEKTRAKIRSTLPEDAHKFDSRYRKENGRLSPDPMY